MLETEEVDDDYFTPVASTSLSNIFGSPRNEGGQNESLKYTPPKPQDVSDKPEESKATQCLFASALIAYEWFNNTYTARGKVGFAIIKFLKSGQSNIVVYDSNKTTLSSALISPTFEITVNGTSFISYYDSSKKYWSIYATEKEIKQIYELLKTLCANVNYSLHKDKGPPEPSTQGHSVISTIEHIDKTDKGSDTDSSVNRRTKISILNRMASMGHSVLPTHTKLADKSSDSSDTNDSNHHVKTMRHKTTKSIVKRDRNTPEKDLIETQSLVDHHETATVVLKNVQTAEKSPFYSYVSQQLVPLNQTNVLPNSSTNSSNDMNIFLSEQRISNSELRINMNRITDKVDMVLNKISDLEGKDTSDSTSDFQTQILQKLLREYENKIKVYEEILQTNGIIDVKFTSNSSLPGVSQASGNQEINCLQTKITELEQINKHQCAEISKLQEEIIFTNKKLCDESQSKINETNELSKKIFVLEDSLKTKNDELVKITKELEIMESSIQNKVKNIMNDTFRALSSNFENSGNYAGDTIKTLIAAVIKKVTIDSLNR